MFYAPNQDKQFFGRKIIIHILTQELDTHFSSKILDSTFCPKMLFVWVKSLLNTRLIQKLNFQLSQFF